MPGVTTLYSERQIAERVGELARTIAADLPAEFVIVALLKGSFVFVADLIRALHDAGARPEVEFMRLSSYGVRKVSSGEVHLLGDVPTDIAGKSVLLVDDILDTGRSIAYARALLEQREIARLWTCVLVDKPSRHNNSSVGLIPATIAPRARGGTIPADRVAPKAKSQPMLSALVERW